ncbi:hypothetical protein H1R20_g8936, partial [Candolleomyces eurysporus]
MRPSAAPLLQHERLLLVLRVWEAEKIVKLRVHFLEDQLARLARDQTEAALSQNINVEIEVQQCVMDKVIETQQSAQPQSHLSAARAGRGREDDTSISSISSNREAAANRSRSTLHQKLEAVTSENTSLHSKLSEQQGIIERLEDENADLTDSIAGLELEQLHDCYSRKHDEKFNSKAALLEEQEARDELQGELTTSQDDVETKNRELDDLVAEHERIVISVESEWKAELSKVEREWKKEVARAESEWREEVEETRNQMDELRDVLNERDGECKELRLHLTELEDKTEEMHAKFNDTLGQLEDEIADLNSTITSLNNELDEKDDLLAQREAELERTRQEVESLGERCVDLEDEVDRARDDVDRTREEDGLVREAYEREKEEWEVERVRSDAVVAGFREKNATLKSELEDLQDAFSESQQTIQDHLARQVELASHIERLVAELESTQSSLTSTRSEFDSLTREYETQIRTLTL